MEPPQLSSVDESSPRNSDNKNTIQGMKDISWKCLSSSVLLMKIYLISC